MKAIIAQEKKRVLMSMGVSNGGVECVDLD